VWLIVSKHFFCPGELPVALFFARKFARGFRQNQSLTKKNRADLPVGKKNDSLSMGQNHEFKSQL
jgi:hypothetical protein